MSDHGPLQAPQPMRSRRLNRWLVAAFISILWSFLLLLVPLFFAAHIHRLLLVPFPICTVMALPFLLVGWGLLFIGLLVSSRKA
jgi:hypothetical protein